jgi:hypothetical protein
MPKLGAPLDFNQLEALSVRVHNATSAPSSPVRGQMYYNSTPGNETLYWFDGSVWQSAKGGGGGTPTGSAGGDLAGTYPNPTLSPGIIDNADVNASAAIAESKLALASDAVAGTASRRTLGTGATQAAAGNDARFTDSRAPSGNAGGDLAGTYPNPDIKAGVIVDADVNVAAAIAESKLSLASDAVAGTASRRTLGSGAQQAAAGNDARFTDSRAPNGAAGGDLTGSYPSPGIAANVIVDGDVNTGAAIAESKLALASDAAVGTASRRTLGLGALQAMPGNTRLDQITAPTNNLAMAGLRITGLQDPSGLQDAATKFYVDNVATGLDVKASVKGASTANIASLSGSPGTVDAVTYITGDRILVKDQTTQAQNGIYVVNTAGAWTRATDMDNWAEVPAAFVVVEQGTNNAETVWICASDPGGTLGTTAITFTQLQSAASILAGNGLLRTGNTIDIVLAGGNASGLTLTADSLAIGTGLITNPMIGAAEINLTTKVTGVLPIANGGTNGATAPAARTSLGASGYYSSATHGAGTTINITQATHGLRASRGLIVQVQEEATGNVVMPDISVAANGDVTVTFAVSQTANTMRVTVIG